jgi:hypothetical protein
MATVPMESTSNTVSQQHWPIVHISMQPNQQLEFYGTDVKERIDPTWQGNSISYKFNSSGLRMDKELKDINRNYIVAFGCSHTVGVGLPLEDTWIHLVSKELDIDYVNSAVVGSSVKLNAINFFNMLNTVDVLPKAVIFAWPSSTRYCFFHNQQFVFYLPNYIPTDTEYSKFSESYRSLLMTDFNVTESAMYRNMIKTTCSRLGIKYIDFGFDQNDDFTINEKVAIIKLAHPEYARDGSHYGISHHQSAANLIKNSLRLSLI